MEFRTLGKTGLKVSRVGLGSGGPSKLGQSDGVSEEDVRRLVRRAFELGINFVDTAAGYGDSEAILGRALDGVPRDDYVLATKFHAALKGEFMSPDEITESIERSLIRLKTDYIDVLQVHGVDPPDYKRTISLVVPILEKMKEQGKCRFTGVSEGYVRDYDHEMIPMAVSDGYFDTAMVGYNLLSPVAEKEVLPVCETAGVGVIGMVAVRRALSRPDLLKSNIIEAKRLGLIEEDAISNDAPLDWLLSDDVTSLPAAGYKFVAAHRAVATILTGTANLEHLEANVASILGPPLPDDAMDRLKSIFGNTWVPLGDDIKKTQRA
jgi:L-galactose dehydrogenase